MSVVKRTLEENYIFFIKELVRIDSEMKMLPIGNISLKKIDNTGYYYHQWREGKRVKSISLGPNVPSDLLEAIKKRKGLEQQRKEILENMQVITKVIDPERTTAEEIIKEFSKSGIKTLVIGSHCLPAIKEKFGFNLPTLKTQDIDFLINTPYRDEEVDVDLILKKIGFSRGFNPDGATYFTNGVYKVEFLTPEKGKGTDKAIFIKPLHISAAPLRYLQMLCDDPVKIEKDDYVYVIPNPWVVAYHKLLIARIRKEKSKREKDQMQALSILRELSKRPEMLKKALWYLSHLPKNWTKEIRKRVNELDKFLYDTMF